jgi:predicted MPP superfamily phosphohydrolase
MPWFIRTILIVSGFLIVVYGYCGYKLYTALQQKTSIAPRKLKTAIILLAVYLNVFPLAMLIMYWLGGREATRIFTGESSLIDILLVYPAWFGLVITVQLLLLFLLTDVIKLLGLRWYRKARERWKQWESAVVIGLTVVVVLYSTTRIYFDTWTTGVREYTITVPHHLADLDGLTIALIADIQGDERTTPERIRKFVELVNSLNPDFIMFGGDVVTSGDRFIESTLLEMRALRGRIANVAAIGDHDIFSHKEKILNGLRTSGFIIAEDSSILFTVGKLRIAVTIVTNTYRQRPESEYLANGLAGVSADYRILLTHQPSESLVRSADDAGYDLFLAGHTHGGSLAFGIPGIFLWAPSHVETRFVSGHYRASRLQVVVTNGLGHTLTPIRFQAPTEVTLLRLHADH